MRRFAFVAVVLCSGSHVYAQTPRPRILATRPIQRRLAERPGLLILNRMMQAEQSISFLAHEVSTDASGRTVEQWVKRDPKRGVRREGIKPITDILVDNGQKAWHLDPRGRKLSERSSLLPEVQRRFTEAMRRLGGSVRAELQGQDTIAGRTADIVAILPRVGAKGPSRRLWIDRDSGLRLKTEEQDPEGRVRSSTYFLTITLNPTFRDDEFAAPPLPPGYRIVKDLDRRFTTLEQAQKAGVMPKVPVWLPTGFELLKVRASQDSQNIHLSWGNSLSTVSLLQAHGPLPMAIKKKLAPAQSGFFTTPRGEKSYAWMAGETYFVVMGNLPEDQLKKIADSVK